MPTRRAAAFVTAVALACGACGSDDSPGTATDPGEAPSTSSIAASRATLPEAYVELGIDLDVDRVYADFCMAWRFDLGRDDGAINDAIADFLSDQPDRSSLYTPGQLDDAVRAGCAEDSATEGISTTLEALSLTSPAIEKMIDAACLRYAHAPSIRGEPGAREFDAHISSLLRLDHDELTSLVVDVCGTDVFDSYEDPASVLPARELTPGEFRADFDLGAACRARPTSPPIPTEMADAVLETYGVSAAGFEVQRLVPAGLGGVTTPTNLFPIPIDAHPGARDKPQVDTLVIGLVCDGTVSIDVARAAIIDNWPTAFANLDR